MAGFLVFTTVLGAIVSVFIVISWGFSPSIDKVRSQHLKRQERYAKRRNKLDMANLVIDKFAFKLIESRMFILIISFILSMASAIVLANI